MTRATRAALAESPKARGSIPCDANPRRFCDCRRFALEGPSVEGQLLQHDRDHRGICACVLRPPDPDRRLARMRGQHSAKVVTPEWPRASGGRAACNVEQIVW